MYQNWGGHWPTISKTISALLHWDYNHSGWILLFQAHLFASSRLCASTGTLQPISLSLSARPQKLRIATDGLCRKLYNWRGQMSVTERWFAVRAGGSSILVLGAPRSSVRHGGVRCAVIRSDGNVIGQFLESCTTNPQECRQELEIIIGTHSSMFGSKPSKTILFLIAMTGTPCDR